MSGGGNTTTVQRADPWRGVQPQLLEAVGDAQRLYDRGGFNVDPFPDRRVATPSGATRDAQQMMLEQAGQPTAAGAGQSTLIDMLQGSDGIYRDLDAVRAEALGGAIPAAVAQFSGNGMTDSSAAMDTVGRAATQAIAPIEYGAWQNAQQNQLRAAGLAPTLDQGALLPAQITGQVGAQQDALAQAQIDARMQRWYERENMRPNALANYSNLLMGFGGQGGSSSMTQPGASTGSQIAGAAATGLGAYGLLAGAGLGGPIGGGLAAMMALGGLL